MNAVIYCRVSSKEQVDGTSLQSQEAACVQYARAHNMTVLRTFIEEGESAKFADRPQLLALLDFVREHKHVAQSLIVWKVDRFARNVADHFNIKTTLMKHGVQIVSVTEPIEANPMGQLMETILAGFAQFDNDIRATRTVNGMRRKIEEGIHPWRPPVGYKSVRTPGNKKTTPDIPDEPTFGLLKEAWNRMATGHYTKAQIMHQLKGAGFESISGRKLNDQSIDDVFRNPYYAGILVDPWSGKEFRAKHTPMVAIEDFARVQTLIRKGRQSMPHTKARSEFPLRGTVRCGNCRKPLTASFSRGATKRFAYYYCWRDNCEYKGRTIRVQDLHDEFITWLGSLRPREELITVLSEISDEVASTTEKPLCATESRHATCLAKELDELISMRTKGLLSDDEFQTAKAELDARRYAAIELEGDVRNKRELSAAACALIQVTMNNLSAVWQKLSPDRHGKFEVILLPYGFVNGSLRTSEVGPLFKVFSQNEDGDSGLVPPPVETSISRTGLLKAAWELLDVLGYEEEEKKEIVLNVQRRSRRRRRG